MAKANTNTRRRIPAAAAATRTAEAPGSLNDRTFDRPRGGAEDDLSPAQGLIRAAHSSACCRHLVHVGVRDARNDAVSAQVPSLSSTSDRHRALELLMVLSPAAAAVAQGANLGDEFDATHPLHHLEAQLILDTQSQGGTVFDR